MKKKIPFCLFALLICFNAFAQTRLAFRPAHDGFHFRNDFKSHGPIQTSGLCGGMCLAAFNYFRFHMNIPTQQQEDMDFDVNYDLSLRTSGADPLTEYIFQSQLATFTNSSILAFSGVADPDYQTEFNKAVNRIDHGQYLILGLKLSFGAGHQVLCYGYDRNGSKLFVYDPNTPDMETTITPVNNGSSILLTAANGQTDTRFHAIFEQQELLPNKLSDRTTYDVADNVLRDLNYAVRPPAVLPPPKRTNEARNFGYTNNNINYEPLLPETDIYRISGNSNQKSVEVEDAAFSKGSKVQQYFSYERNGLCDGKNQQWLLIPAGKKGTETVFYIINYGFLKYLQAGTPVTVEHGNSFENNQLWFLQPSGNSNQFLIKSVSSGQYLQMPAGNNDGMGLTLSNYTGAQNQIFTFTHLAGQTNPGPLPAGQFFNISPAGRDSKGLDIVNAGSGNDIPVKVWDITGNNGNQEWQLTRVAGGYYTIKPRAGNGRKCAEVYGFSPDENMRVESYDCANTSNQLWVVVPVIREPGKYIFINKNSGKCLGVPAGNDITNGSVTGQMKFIASNEFCKWKINKAR